MKKLTTASLSAILAVCIHIPTATATEHNRTHKSEGRKTVLNETHKAHKGLNNKQLSLVQRNSQKKQKHHQHQKRSEIHKKHRAEKKTSRAERGELRKQELLARKEARAEKREQRKQKMEARKQARQEKRQ